MRVHAALAAVLLLAPLLALAPPAVSQASGPDLAVTGAAMTPAAPAPGQEVTFNATLRNLGDVAATASLAFLLDGTTLYVSPPVVLVPGAFLDVATPEPWIASEGSHAYLARADPDDEVGESDEENNEDGFVFHIGAKPNLRVGALTVAPAAPRDGDAVVVTATVVNDGDAAAGPFLVALRVDGEEVGNTTVAGLEPGAQANATASWNATAGAHVAAAAADSTGVVEETDETDNNATRPFTVAPPPARADLMVLDLRWSPPLPKQEETVRFEALVRNAGNLSAAATTTRFLLDGALLGEVGTPGLGPRTEVWVVAPEWTAVAGAHVIRAVADARDQVAEVDETNNGRTASFGVAPAGPKPDLFLESLALSPEAPEEGAPVTLLARLRNGGGAPAPASVVEFRAGDAVVGSASAPALAPGAFADVASPPWRATPGPVRFLGRADATAVVEEGQEDNNNHTLALTIPPAKPDLVLDALRSEPAVPRPGDDVVFEVVVRNAGNGSAPAPTEVQFRVDGRPVGAVPVPPLAAGASATLRSAAWDALQGARLARALLDPAQRVAERDEANNERTLPLPSLSRLPNLVVEDLRLEGAEVAEGAPLRLVAVVANRGSEASGATDLRFDLEGANQSLVALPALPAGGLATVHSRNVTAEAGARTARAFADASRRVPELSEEDNTRTARFVIADGTTGTTEAQGLVLRDLRIEPSSPSAGDRVGVTATVWNEAATAAEGVALRLRVDGVEVARDALDPVPAGGRASGAMFWEATPGSHTLEVDVLRDGRAVVAAPLRTLTVDEAKAGVPWEIILLAFTVIGLAAAGLERRRGPT